MKSKKIIFSMAIILSLCALAPFGKKIGAKALKKLAVERRSADISVVGPIVMADGIGRQTVELAQVLAKKFLVQIRAEHVDKTDLPKNIRPMLKQQFAQPAKVVIVEESLWAPGAAADRFFSTVDGKDQIRFAYSMLESTRIVPEWVMMINLYFDAVIVPDPFLIDAYVKSGVHVPVFCIPLGLDMQPFLAAPLKKAKEKGPLIFACLGSAIDRKNHKMAIQAFAKVLGNNENACLHINCRNGTQETQQEIIDEIAKQKCTNIKYTEICLRKDAYLKFFRSVDCLLSLSKGEGFAIQPREAMALGVPSIVTDNTAQSTICQSGLVKVVPSTIPEPCYYFDRPINGGERFNCTVEDCAAAIEDVYLNYSKYLEKGAAMREWASAYDYSCLAEQYECLVSPQKIVLSDVNQVTADCIYTDSSELYQKYLNLMKSR